MKLIKPKYEILQVTPLAPQHIERCGRVCYKSEIDPKTGELRKLTPESGIRFCKMLYDRGHHSVLEHSYATVHFTIDRGMTHELVRHRIASFSQESTRYCDYSPDGKKKMGLTFIIPPWVDLPEGEYTINGEYDTNFYNEVWFQALLNAEEEYNSLIHLGWKPEQARSVLPNSLKSEIVITANAREWLHIFELRCAEAAHPQMREIMQPLEKELIPLLFGQMLNKDST